MHCTWSFYFSILPSFYRFFLFLITKASGVIQYKYYIFGARAHTFLIRLA